MPQLELGVLPLAREITEGMVVVFFVSMRINNGRGTKRTVSRIGRVLSVEDSAVVIEDIVAPGSRYNRPVERVFEVHKDTSLETWAK